MICLPNRRSLRLSPPQNERPTPRPPKMKLQLRGTQVRVALLSSSRVKHLVGTDSKKIGGMRNVRNILLKSPTNQLKD
ncbi:unnamed protein product [Prunus armeniaca]